MKPWFQMYAGALALVKDRTRLYYQHDGAAFPETMCFWGLPNLGDFGWNNPSNQIQSPWIRHHIQGSLEVIAQALDLYEFTQDDSFARQVLVPISEAVVTYYDQHWTRDAKGKIRMAPVQSLETYQQTAVNPTPDIAGLKSVLPRLLALPEQLMTREQRDVWTRVLRDLPPIPMGKTAKGKVRGKGDDNGDTIICRQRSMGKPATWRTLSFTWHFRIVCMASASLTWSWRGAPMLPACFRRTLVGDRMGLRLPPWA